MPRALCRSLLPLGVLVLAAAQSAAQATIQTPPPGSTLSGTTETFSWNAARGADQYWLRVGSTRNGGEIFNQSVGTSLSAVVSGLPSDGSRVYVRLSSLYRRHWRRSYAAYTASGSVPEPEPTPVPTPPPSGGTGTRYFPSSAPWYQDISTAPLDPESDRVISYLSINGWGSGTMRIDFSIEVLQATADTPLLSFNRTSDFFTPDCDYQPVPVPKGGALEGETGYSCDSNGDCHLIVADWGRMTLFEMWRADIRNGVFNGGCLAAWDMSRQYPPSGRGEQCTSADAAGYPIAPLLFNADEVAAGLVDHAIRFILPNARIRSGFYVHPATHVGAPGGPPDAPPYGARLRLRADYPIASLPAGARPVARAMQRYGMLLADGGTIALTAQSDRFTKAKWSGLMDSYSLRALKPSDFQMVDGGPRIRVTYDCVRN
jgi:serine/threonine-protein kinase